MVAVGSACHRFAARGVAGGRLPRDRGSDCQPSAPPRRRSRGARTPRSNGRVDTALSLIRQHVAGSLVVSVPSDSQRRAMPLCTAPQDGFSVNCFQPHPATTRGEAAHARDLARQHGWTSVVVVTSTYHVSRARMIFNRCLDGKLYLVAARRGISMLTWAYQYLYQTGAYVKAVYSRAARSPAGLRSCGSLEVSLSITCGK